MRETHRINRYASGDYWRECAVCGFDYLRSEMVYRWDGLLVCIADNDIRNPQDTPTYNHAHPPFHPDGSGEISIITADEIAMAAGPVDGILDQDDQWLKSQDGDYIVDQGS